MYKPLNEIFGETLHSRSQNLEGWPPQKKVVANKKKREIIEVKRKW